MIVVILIITKRRGCLGQVTILNVREAVILDILSAALVLSSFDFRNEVLHNNGLTSRLSPINPY